MANPKEELHRPEMRGTWPNHFHNSLYRKKPRVLIILVLGPFGQSWEGFAQATFATLPMARTILVPKRPSNMVPLITIRTKKEAFQCNCCWVCYGLLVRILGIEPNRGTRLEGPGSFVTLALRNLSRLGQPCALHSFEPWQAVGRCSASRKSCCFFGHNMNA